MLRKILLLLPHLFCNAKFEFSWFFNTNEQHQTIIRDFNSENRNAVWVSKWDEYHNYWVLINAFWIHLDLSDIDMWDMDLSDTDLDLLDADISSKHFVYLQDVLKTFLEDVFKTCLQDVFETSSA